MIIVNFKHYKKGKGVLELAKKIDKILGKKAVVCVPPAFLAEISEHTKLKVYGQHVDYGSGKRSTGFLNSEELKSLGISGSLLNHSEHKLNIEEIKKTLESARKAGIKIILCAASLSEVRRFLDSNLRPEAIAFEDPELIGTGKSITGHNPTGLKKFVSLLGGVGIKAICGAGISSASDVLEAKKLGCSGVLVASAVAKAKDPRKILKELKTI